MDLIQQIRENNRKKLTRAKMKLKLLFWWRRMGTK